eukprot:CAMPEP_0174971592 /NCGR_PEP_ID=MMETSP0004_2-20121128/10102_1 /TAXON_ID=420556 /ORGANISM="Ochromonas sp., Strain CCMP1393" /LENGTH=428 /DNA_ID=CAMNT_0016221607 /DNA_START=425 /DNA_END=1711 /DNA_ORIENTATION=+
MKEFGDDDDDDDDDALGLKGDKFAHLEEIGVRRQSAASAMTGSGNSPDGDTNGKQVPITPKFTRMSFTGDEASSNDSTSPASTLSTVTPPPTGTCTGTGAGSGSGARRGKRMGTGTMQATSAAMAGFALLKDDFEDDEEKEEKKAENKTAVGDHDNINVTANTTTPAGTGTTNTSATVPVAGVMPPSGHSSRIPLRSAASLRLPAGQQHQTPQQSPAEDLGRSPVPPSLASVPPSAGSDGNLGKPSRRRSLVTPTVVKVDQELLRRHLPRSVSCGVTAINNSNTSNNSSSTGGCSDGSSSSSNSGWGGGGVDTTGDNVSTHNSINGGGTSETIAVKRTPENTPETKSDDAADDEQEQEEEEEEEESQQQQRKNEIEKEQEGARENSQKTALEAATASVGGDIDKVIDVDNLKQQADSLCRKVNAVCSP